MKTINELVTMHLEDVYAAIKNGSVDKDTFLEFMESQSDDAYGSGADTASIMVLPLPVAGTITGADSVVCVGSTITLNIIDTNYVTSKIGRAHV